MKENADTDRKPVQFLETDNPDWTPIVNIPTSQQYSKNGLYTPIKKKFLNKTEKPYARITKTRTSVQKQPDFDLVQNESSGVDTVKNGDPIPNYTHNGTKRMTIYLVDAQTQTDMSGDDFNKLQKSNDLLIELRKTIGKLVGDVSIMSPVKLEKV